MALAYKMLDRNGTSTKGGRTWPMPDEDGPGPWISTIHGRDKYYLCKRDNIVLWIDRGLFVAEFGEMIEEDMGDLKVPDARLVKKILSWNNTTQKGFMTNCVEYAMTMRDLSEPSKQQYGEQLERAYAAKDLMGISRFAVHLAPDPTEETKRQNEMIWKYVQDEVINSFSEDEFA